MVRLAAEKATPQDVQRLRERLKEHEASLASLDQFLERDMAFHREIARNQMLFPLVAC
ncbi:MAG: FCD domain-containing protein [Sediminibacterium sp.]